MSPIIMFGGAIGTPPNEVSGCTAWWRADAQVYSDAGTTPCVDNDNVYRWTDVVGGLLLQQTTESKRPTWKQSGQNGNPAIYFPQTASEELGPLSNIGSTLLTAGAGTVFASFHSEVTGASTCPWMLYAAAFRAGLTLGTGGQYDSGNYDTNLDTASDSGTVNDPGVHTWLHGSGTLYSGINVTQTANMVSAASGNTADLATSALYTRSAGIFYKGYIMDLVFFNTVVSEGDRQDICAYLANRIGVTMGG